MNLQGRELKLELSGDDVRLLHSELAQIGLAVPEAELRGAFFGRGTHNVVSEFQKQHQLPVTGEVDEVTARAVNQAVDSGTYTVEGSVASSDRAGVGGLRIVIVDKNVGDDTFLVETVTDDRGRYLVRFAAPSLRERRKIQPDLQARASRGDNFLAASGVRYNASSHESLDIELPLHAPLPSEHETLIDSLAQHFGGRLGDVKETDDRRDITYLANKTGWDARAVALASLSDQFSQHRAEGAADGLPSPLYYALFRAGLPADPDTLYRVDAQTVGRVWKNAVEQGVIPEKLGDQLPRALEAFQSLSARRALDAPALAGVSSLKEMLHLSLGENEQRQLEFATLYTREHGDLIKFWDAVSQSFGEESAKRLQLDGQLGYLTLNNAPLIARIHQTEANAQLSSTLELAQRGYHNAQKWVSILDGAVPDGIPGNGPEEKRANYADLLSAQIRISFPTTVLASMVRSGEIPLNAPAEVQDGVHSFLTKHQGEFEIGLHPLEQFLVRNELQGQVDAPVKEQIKLLQRVYQITTNDQAIAGLMKNNLHSAYEIVRYDESEFVETFKDQMGGAESARLTYLKSQQVHNTVLNIASTYITSRNAPTLGSGDQAMIVNHNSNGAGIAAPNAADVIAYPTLEALLGSMDYCACEHCRSILSPAAYLVDLLLFIDRPINAKENPQTVLLERRPDIQHLPLTCENTNTPLPYIDVVNETLEYFVTHNLSLTNFAGHDTDGTISSAELLAGPQFVSDAAYAALKAEIFPPPLPFHQPLEALRRYFERFEVPLQMAMKLLRSDDSIERSSPSTYGWRDVLMEQLRLSRDEYALLTDRTLTLGRLFGYAPATPTPDVLAGLGNVKSFSRRTRVSYENVIELLKTKFVNPNSFLIPRVEKLGVPIATLKGLKDGTIADATFDALLPTDLDLAEYGGDAKTWVRDASNFARIMGLIVIANPKSDIDSCSFDDFEFRYANPDNNANSLRAIEYMRLLRFIRLWKKLGWTIAQTDQALSALFPAGDLPSGVDDAVDLQHLDNGFLTFLPRLGSVVEVMKRLNANPKRDLSGLLTLWSPIDTFGPGSMYRRMFLAPTLLKQDSAFADDGFGNFLEDNTRMLVAHSEALRGAFGLTGEELTSIVSDLGFDGATPLSLDNVSAVFRRGWLARKLRISIRELLLLIKFSGIDPFVAPDPPNPAIIRLFDLVQALKAASLKPVQALYLIWNQDISGRSAPDHVQVADFARALRAGFIAIESEFTVADDPTGEISRARMALVYGGEATDFFFGLLGNTLALNAPYSQAEAALVQAILDVAPERIGYDDFRKRLTFAGVLSIAMRDALKSIVGVSVDFQTAVDILYAASQSAIGPFFTRYPELVTLFNNYVASPNPPEVKRTALLASFIPELKRRRKRQQAFEAVSAVTRTDSTFAQPLLDAPAVLHSASDVAKPAVEDFTAVEAPGLAVAFFSRNAATGTIDSAVETVPMIDYSASGSNKLPANPVLGDSISGIWGGLLEAPESGFFNVAVEVDVGAIVSLTIGGKGITLIQNGNVWTNQIAIELKAGTLSEIKLTVENVKVRVALRWQTIGRGWEIIPARYLYSATLFDHLRDAYVRFLKVSSLATSLKLTADEIAHHAIHVDHAIDGHGWVNALTVSGETMAATAKALLDVVISILSFARLKTELAPDDERLLTVLRDPGTKLANGDSLLQTLTGWEKVSLNDLLARFGANQADLSHLSMFQRVFDAYTIVKTFGISASILLKSVTNEPTGATVRDLQSALRARYDESDWLEVVKPINDELRGLQRDALVAYVLQKFRESPLTQHIDTADKLFEYFLMDVQMEPCMETSRIRHALSSVQLFIERCLMNLEPRVAPTSIKSKQWEWMKRYRIWEANRKVFLWPENWLEPELRDDQSPFFKETMSELLQSDITEDTAATALLNYLSKLEEVAKLEVCGLYFVENDAGTADDIAHVVARTAGAQRKYYYRRREYGYWTPWEQIKLEIEDNPVRPIVWKNRLFLFWLRILKQAPLDTQKPGNGDVALTSLKTSDIKTGSMNMTIQAVLCWSEYYNGKWQPTKTSDVERPAKLVVVDSTNPASFDRSRLDMRAVHEGEALRIMIQGEGWSSFLLYNTHSLPVPQPSYGFEGGTDPRRGLSTWLDAFTIYYDKGGPLMSMSSSAKSSALTRPVLINKIEDGTVEPRHPLKDQWNAPFFYQDGRHAFYVSTSERLVSIGKYRDFGVYTATPKYEGEIPPLVIKKDSRFKVFPPKGDHVFDDPRIVVTDPSPIARFVTEDVNIRTGISTAGSVRFGDRLIGPGGAIADQQMR